MTGAGRIPATVYVTLTAALLGACSGVRVTVEPPPEPLHSEQTDAWMTRIAEVAESGDWLVVRGYKATDNLIVAATNMPLSHAAVVDREAGEIIEATAKGVGVVALRDFVHHTHRVLVIRPKWWTPARGQKAVAESRRLVGRPYDFLGVIGAQVDDRYYCSELAVEAYRPWHAENEHLPGVIEPGQMFFWGTILYDSGSRD